jgi:hypothetical protein
MLGKNSKQSKKHGERLIPMVKGESSVVQAKAKGLVLILEI